MNDKCNHVARCGSCGAEYDHRTRREADAHAKRMNPPRMSQKTERQLVAALRACHRALAAQKNQCSDLEWKQFPFEPAALRLAVKALAAIEAETKPKAPAVLPAVLPWGNRGGAKP